MPDTAGRGTRDARRWTRKAVLALPDDGRRYELIDGELVVTPAPRGVHQVAVSALEAVLRDALRGTGPAHVLHSPADITLGDDEILQPDLFVYRTASGRHLLEWTDITELVLVIEVLSPSTARYDRELKRRRYQRAGVPEYWIVDLDGRVVERWRPEDTRPEQLAGVLHWAPGGDIHPALDLPGYFAGVWGE
jgi:Uma2 family endonuclease